MWRQITWNSRVFVTQPSKDPRQSSATKTSKILHKNELLLLVVFNRCPFQLLRSYKRHEENKRNIGQERSSCSRPTSNVIGPLHECKKVCPCTKALSQSGICEWIKQSRRKIKREEERQERQRLGGWWKERQPNKTKPYLTKLGGGTPPKQPETLLLVFTQKWNFTKFKI